MNVKRDYKVKLNIRLYWLQMILDTRSRTYLRIINLRRSKQKKRIYTRSRSLIIFWLTSSELEYQENKINFHVFRIVRATISIILAYSFAIFFLLQNFTVLIAVDYLLKPKYLCYDICTHIKLYSHLTQLDIFL